MADRYTLNLKAIVDAKNIKNQLKEVSKTTTIKLDAKGGKEATTIITKLESKLGDTQTEVKKLDGSGKLLGSTLVTTSKAAQTFGEKLSGVGKKIQSVNGVFQALKNVVVNFEAAVQPVLEFEDSLTELKKVSNLSGEALDEYTRKLGKLGQEVGKSRSEMVDAATEFVKSGFSESDSSELARVANLYINIADEELNAGEAANFIISQMKAFNMTAQDAMHIIDAVNNVSNNTAVSSADLATNIGKASAALAAGGNTYEDVLSLMTAGVEITRSGAKVSRALVSVQSRYNQTIDETSSTGKKLVKWYSDHNIAIKDQEGQQRKLYDTLSDVSEIWNQLSKDEQLYYLNIQAGANQTQNLSAILQNFDQVLNAHDLALDASGSALDENARAMENLNKKIDSIKASWKEIVIEFVNSESVGDILDRINDALRSLADHPERIEAITKAVKGFLGIWVTSKAISFIGGVVTQFKSFVRVLKELKIVLDVVRGVEFIGPLTAMQSSIIGVIGALTPLLPLIGTLAGLMTAAGVAIGFASGKFQEMYNKHIANTSDDVNKVANAYRNLVSAFKDVESSKGTYTKKVTGQEAVDIQIEKLEELQKSYKDTKDGVDDFLKRAGDISPLRDYYNSLQNIIDSGGTLDKTQEDNYNSLKILLGAYDAAKAKQEAYKLGLQAISNNTTSVSKIQNVYKNDLVQVGNTYYWVSNAAKQSAIATQKAIIAEAKAVIKNTKAEIKARKALAESLGVPMYDGFGIESPQDKVDETIIKRQEKLIKTANKAIKDIESIEVQGVSTKGGGGSGSGSGSGKGSGESEAEKKKKEKEEKEKKDAQARLKRYKKWLENYEATQREYYQKGVISASEYYSNVQKKGEYYYNLLKKRGKNYASAASSMWSEYKDKNSEAVKELFGEIDYRYEEGKISGQEYYKELWKYAKKFYKNGKLDFSEYRDYVNKGYKAMFEDIKKQYDNGEITAEQYFKKVKKAEKNANASITSARKKGTITKSTAASTRNALTQATVDALNAAAQALKEAAIKAAEAAVEAAEKKLKEAQARQDKANTFISALQFYATEQQELIDKEIDGYNEQIDALNEKLSLMEEQNEALDRQAERMKLVKELEEAKKQKTVRVYDSRLGWIWTADPKAVQDAQTALDEFDTERKREQEKQAIQDQIDAINDLIKKKEQEKQAYQDVINEQSKALERYNIEAELGKTIEAAIFAERTQNFNNWKDSYVNGVQEVIAATEAVNTAQSELDSANAALDAANNMEVPVWKAGVTTKTGSTYYYTDDMSAVEKWNAGQAVNIQARKDQGYNIEKWTGADGKVHYTAKKPTTPKKPTTSTSGGGGKRPTSTKSNTGGKKPTPTKSNTGGKRPSSNKKKASGSLSLPQTGIYNINELGDELIVPPKGNFDYLKKGTGVIPADLTQNLMDWGKFNPKNLIGSQPSVTNNDHSITIQSLTVKSDNAKDFVRQLQNLAIVRS